MRTNADSIGTLDDRPLGLKTLAEVRAYLKGHRAGFNSAMRQWEESIDEMLAEQET